MKKNIIYLIVFLFAVASCKRKDISNPDVPAGLPEQKIMGLSYGTDAKQKLDLYLPKNRTIANTPLLVIIHGGGWTSGDRSDLTQFVDTFKRRLPEFAVANISYRLNASATINPFPTQENDVNAAINFLNSKAAEYNYGGKGWFYLGVSAGGHLAMLQGYKNNLVIKPKAIASFYGPSDMADMYNNPVGNNQLISLGIQQVMGGKTPTTDSTLYANSSPINFINSNDPPTILLHGGNDLIVAPSQSSRVRDKLAMNGVEQQYVFYPTQVHGWIDQPTLFDSFNKIETFFKARL